MAQFLDENGLRLLWSKIKSLIQDTGLVIDGSDIIIGNNNFTHNTLDSISIADSMIVDAYDGVQNDFRLGVGNVSEKLYFSITNVNAYNEVINSPTVTSSIKTRVKDFFVVSTDIGAANELYSVKKVIKLSDNTYLSPYDNTSTKTNARYIKTSNFNIALNQLFTDLRFIEEIQTLSTQVQTLQNDYNNLINVMEANGISLKNE